MLTTQYAKALTDIRVNAADPGYTATDLNGHSGPQTVTEGTDAIVALATEGPGAGTGRFVARHGEMPGPERRTAPLERVDDHRAGAAARRGLNRGSARRDEQRTGHDEQGRGQAVDAERGRAPAVAGQDDAHVRPRRDRCRDERPTERRHARHGPDDHRHDAGGDVADALDRRERPRGRLVGRRSRGWRRLVGRGSGGRSRRC